MSGSDTCMYSEAVAGMFMCNRSRTVSRPSVVVVVVPLWGAVLMSALLSPLVDAVSLPPSLLCSACEVTAREIFNGYTTTLSEHDRFAGTEVELALVLEEACTRVSKYKLAQEAFGSHLKVFADEKVKFDVQNVEPPEYYGEADEQRYHNALALLHQKCLEYIGEFEDSIGDLVRRRVDEAALRRFMCRESTPVCTDATLAPHRKKEAKRRRRWKRRVGRERMREKLARELNENLEEVQGVRERGGDPKPSH